MAPTRTETLRQDELWTTDSRIGIGLDHAIRAAAEGKIFSTDAVAPQRGVGLLAGVSGAQDKLPHSGMVRLGGDGRAAAVRQVPALAPTLDYAALAASGHLRVVLRSPGLFPEGWKLPETFGGRVVAAAVPRHAVISGWDLLHWCPKPAERFAPAGSVYWLEGVQTTAEQLQQIECDGLATTFSKNEQKQRRAEGFNAVTFAAWPQSNES